MILSDTKKTDTKIASTLCVSNVGLMQKSIISSLLNITYNNHLVGGNAGVVGTYSKQCAHYKHNKNHQTFSSTITNICKGRPSMISNNYFWHRYYIMNAG